MSITASSKARQFNLFQSHILLLFKTHFNIRSVLVSFSQFSGQKFYTSQLFSTHSPQHLSFSNLFALIIFGNAYKPRRSSFRTSNFSILLLFPLPYIQIAYKEFLSNSLNLCSSLGGRDLAF